MIPMDLSRISRADAAISRADQSSHANRSALVEVQLATELHWVKGCTAATVDPDQWFDD